MNHSRPIFRALARALPLAAFAWPFFASPALGAPSDAGPIFKCTDGSGHVTYQNEPCPKNAKAGRVEIFDNSWSADRAEREAEWRRNAAEHRLATGMPARLVREALGDPSEIRNTPTAGAAQLWLYSLPDRSVQVGMLNDQILWFRETPVAASAARAPAPDRMAQPAAPAPDRTAQPAAPPAAAAPRVAATAASAPADLPVLRFVPTVPERAAAADTSRLSPEASRASTDASRAPSEVPPATPEAARTPSPEATLPVPAKTTARSVARGQDCKQVLADLGPPDHQRDVPAFDTGSDPATEYFYESAAAASGGRLRIVCSNGKVEGVDRSATR